MHLVLLALLLTALTPLQTWAQPTTSPTAPSKAAPANEALTPNEARVQRDRIDAKLAALETSVPSLKMAAPLALTVAGATLLTGSIGGLAISMFHSMLASDGIEEDVRKNDRLRMRLFGTGIAVSAGVMVVSWAILMRRVQARNEARKLRSERKRLDLMIAPDVGPSSYGLSLTSRF